MSHAWELTGVSESRQACTHSHSHSAVALRLPSPLRLTCSHSRNCRKTTGVPSLQVAHQGQGARSEGTGHMCTSYVGGGGPHGRYSWTSTRCGCGCGRGVGARGEGGGGGGGGGSLGQPGTGPARACMLAWDGTAGPGCAAPPAATCSCSCTYRWPTSISAQKDSSSSDRQCSCMSATAVSVLQALRRCPLTPSCGSAGRACMHQAGHKASRARAGVRTGVRDIGGRVGWWWWWLAGPVYCGGPLPPQQDLRQCLGAVFGQAMAPDATVGHGLGRMERGEGQEEGRGGAGPGV